MTIAVQATKLDNWEGDVEGSLVLRDGRLIAVLSCLGDLHEDLAGRWFVEAVFGNQLLSVGDIFETIEQLRIKLEL